jgi:ubiquinone/menaquinone biosynthesis C-methylase UbiE
VNNSLVNHSSREKSFYDAYYQTIQPFIIRDPYLKDDDRKYERFFKKHEHEFTRGQRVLICSCGLGIWPVLFAMRGLKVDAFDISSTAVWNARRFAEISDSVNEITVREMNIYDLEYEDNSFDIVFGESILHHVDCEIASIQIYNVLRVGGKAYFMENSLRNPILKIARDFLFSKSKFGGKEQGGKLSFHRDGTEDENPLSEEEVKIFREPFKTFVRTYEQFTFFSLVSAFGPKFIRRYHRHFETIDDFVGKLKILHPLSFTQTLIFEK